MKSLYFPLLFCVLVTGCVIHVGPGGYKNPDANPDSIFGDIRVSSGQDVQNVNSVNGSIELSHRVSATRVETVNGNVEIGDWVQVSQVITVNGNVRAGEYFIVKDKVETINGNIRLSQHAQIGGDLQSINGNMTLNGVQINGVLFNINGDITLRGKSKIVGDLIYKEDGSENRNNRQNMPVLTIDDDVVIEGNIILKRPVELRIANPAVAEKVIRQFE